MTNIRKDGFFDPDLLDELIGGEDQDRESLAISRGTRERWVANFYSRDICIHPYADPEQRISILRGLKIAYRYGVKKPEDTALDGRRKHRVTFDYGSYYFLCKARYILSLLFELNILYIDVTANSEQRDQPQRSRHWTEFGLFEKYAKPS